MHKKKQRGGGQGGGVKKPARPPGPLKRLPVFANQVPFRFDPATDSWVEVVLPPVPQDHAAAATAAGRRSKAAAKHQGRTAKNRTNGEHAPVTKETMMKEQAEQKEKKENEGQGEHADREEAEAEASVTEPTNRTPRTIKVCTMNVLFDMYDNDRIQTHRRMPALIEILRTTEADIIGLQEVTQPFLIRLLREEWVKRDYYVSDGPLGYSLKPFYGQLILSKLPFHRLITHQFSKSKKVTIAQFMIEEHPVWVPVLHLTSNRKGADLYNKRHLQLQVIFEKICPVSEQAEDKTEVWLMGDFNFEDGEEDRGLPPQWTQFKDVWPTLHPSEPGYTYDPQRNALAAATTSSGKSRRIDRVMMRSGTSGPRWEPLSIELLGTAPLPEPEGGSEGSGTIVFPSDHFGLVATLATAFAPSASSTSEQPQERAE